MYSTWTVYKLSVVTFSVLLAPSRAVDYDSGSLNVVIPPSFATTAIYLDIPDPTVNFTVLDSHITRALQRPSEHNGRDLLRDTKLYRKELEDLAIAMEHTKDGGHELINILDLRNGPSFTRMKINEQLLRSEYKWNRSTFGELMDSINGTRWTMVRLNSAKNATSLEIPADEQSSAESATVEYYF